MRPRISTLAALAITIIPFIAFTNRQARATLVFDDISNAQNSVSGAQVASTGSTPNTFMGDGYTLTPGTIDITGFDLYPVNLTGTNYTGLEINIYVWGSVNTGTVNATTPAFSDLLAQYTLTSAGSFTSGFYYSFQTGSPGITPGISLATPLAIPDSTVGITVNYQGTTDGSTYNSANSLSSLISYGTPPTVGSNVFDGYYRNANSETNGNFTSTLRSLNQPDQSLALRVYGDVPEPASLGLLSLAGLIMLKHRPRKNRSGSL